MLHSDWLLKMLDKAGRTPRERVLALFDILQDWTAVPGLRTDSRESDLAQPADALLAYLTAQLESARADAPQVLATQIYFIALGALQAADNQQAFKQGRQAAALLLDAAQPPRRSTRIAVASAASVLVLALFFGQRVALTPTPPTQTVDATPVAANVVPAALNSSPDQMASLHDSLERMRRGVCQYPQALMLAPESRAVLLENIVDGAVPADAGRMHDARALMQKVECYYPPMAMTAL